VKPFVRDQIVISYTAYTDCHQVPWSSLEEELNFTCGTTGSDGKE